VPASLLSKAGIGTARLPGLKRGMSHGPVTLSDLSRDNKLVWIYCRDCCREVEIAASALPGFSPGTPIPALAARLRCSGCGSRKISATGEVYDGGFIMERARNAKTMLLSTQQRTYRALVPLQTSIHAR
jgi:hypothetical protein